METRSGNVYNTKKDETKVDDPAKLQLGATIGRDAGFEPVALNPNIEIPKYGGTEDPRPWIESLEEIGFLYHWADYIIARYAAMNMTGSAKTWLNLHKASFTSWENIKIRLIQDFSLDANKEELRMKLNRMQHWNEPEISFAEDILVLCNKVDPAMEEETKIEHVIGGLKKEYSFALYLNPPKTTDDLLVVCKKMDSFEKKYRERVEKSRNLYNGPRYSRPQQQSRYVPPTAARNYQATSRPQAPASNNYKNDSPPTPRQYRNNFPQPSIPRRPYNPNFVPKPNLQRNTYNKSQEVSKNRTEDGRPICFKCNKPGHVARYCRVKFIRILEEDPTDTQEKAEEKCQMNEISEKSGPRLYADIGTFEALVDTGADLSVVDLRTALDTGHGISKLAKICAGPDGKKLDMVGSIFLNIKIDDETLSHNFVILKTHLRTLILGRDFLKKMNAKIDCKQETIKYDLTNNHDEINFEMLKIKSAKDSIVPECSIKLIKALVETEDGEYIMEESSKMFQTNGLRLASSLINVINRETHIWITNPYPRPLKIMKNQTLAFVSSPAKINVNREREVEENEEPRSQINENLSPKEQKELKQVLERYGDLFSSRLGRTNLTKHRIDTEDAKPIKHKPYRVSAKERDIIKEQIDEMLTEGIIRPSSSPWSFLVILVKKRDGKYRFCVDYRKLNNVTVKDVYPIPRIDEVMDTLQGSTYFSAIDLRSGYWQVEVEERDKEKTAFTTAHRLYEFNVMPFGLCNAPATFERNMENMLGNLRWQICLCYLDDVIIYSPDFPTHLKRLKAVFRCFRESNLRLNDKKCRFAFEELEILGYITSKHGIKPAENNIKAVRNFPRPKKVDDPAKLQLGATIGRDAGFEPVALNPNIEIPKYGGTEDPRPWIESLEEIGFLYHWADYIIARYAAMNMTGSAKTWLNLHKASFTSWENIKIRLIQDFSLDANKEELRMKLNRMQHWNEPEISFAEDILVLCNKVDPAMEEETKIEHVIGGLKKEYSFALYLNPPKTTDDLLVVCKKMDSFEKKYRERVEKSRNLYNGPRYSRPQQQSRYVPPTAARNYQATSRPQAPASNNYKNDSPPTPRQYRNNFPQPSIPRRPYNPNFVPKPNLQRNTYNKSQEVSKNRTEDGRPICFKCNKPGHVARYCRVKFIRILEEDPTDTQEKAEEKCQMNEISEKSGPRLYADIGTFEALVDTGADLSVVDLRTALDTGHGISKLAKICAGPDGKKLDMVGSIFLNIKIDDETLSHNFVILKTHLRTLILGRDFLKKMNAKIDCKQETIKYDLTNNHDEINFEMLKIKSAKDSIVPECSIKLIKALVETEDGEYIMEESSKMFQTNGLRLASSLINVINRETHIWITNPYPRPLKIMKNQTLAFVSSPAKINVNREREVEENEEPRSQINENLSPKEQKELKQVLERYGDLFSSRLGRTNLTKHRIDTEDAKPIKHKPYRVSAKERDIIKEQIDEMLTEGIIRPSSSPWSFLVILVKKRDGKYRFCVDYRKLNNVTVKDVYPIPRIDEVMDTLQGSTYFSAIDLRSGYWQVEVEERDKEKTAFTTAHRLYEFNVMPFGLCNAPATFERNMENMLGNLRWQICLCYLDDVIIYSPDFPTHLKRLKAVFRCFRESNLRLNDKKCRFAFEELEILGYITSKHDEGDKFSESVKKNLNGSRRSIAQNFKVEDGCLFKKNPNPEGRAWLLVVPEKKKREIMKEYHNHMSNGHLGVARTMYRIKSKYFWPSMLKDVSEFVKTCHLCQSRKAQTNYTFWTTTAPIPPANFPFERIGVDFVGPLPSTKNRKKWIIVLTDYYTRYAETKAVSEATVKELSKFLVEDIFLQHGAPQYLISDRGSQFTSNLMEEVMKMCKIKHCFTTSYHPQTNGLTERLNRTLINMLSMYVNTDQKNWDEILPFITHAYNTTIQETTGYSPFFLMFGREPTSLLDDRNISVDIDKDDYDEYIKHQLDKIDRTRKLVINNTIKTQERMKKNYDKKHMERSNEPGELVAVWTPIRKIGKCEKLLRNYFGPYRILKKMSSVNYLIEPKDNPGQDPLIVHVSRIKPYYERMDEVIHEDVTTSGEGEVHIHVKCNSTCVRSVVMKSNREFENRAAIIVALRAGRSPKEIVDFLKLPKTTIYRVKKQFDEADSNKEGIATRKKHSRRSDRVRGEEFVKNVKEKIDGNPGKSMRAIAKEMDVGSMTIVRTIREDLGLKSYALRKGQLLTENMKNNRKGKAAALLNNLKHDSFGMLRFFSDEKNFDVDQKVNPRNDRWICKDRSEIPVVMHTKFPASVMVLGVISSEGDVMPPHFFEKGLRMNADTYINVLETVVKPWMDMVAAGR
ncbi:hypothetical protein LAZ67_8001791, partial [Cordylochernes scorpioides]